MQIDRPCVGSSLPAQKRPLVGLVPMDPAPKSSGAEKARRGPQWGNPMDQRIEAFLADVLALAGEEPDDVRQGVFQ
jgi:hypothetical protein